MNTARPRRGLVRTSFMTRWTGGPRRRSNAMRGEPANTAPGPHAAVVSPTSRLRPADAEATAGGWSLRAHQQPSMRRPRHVGQKKARASPGGDTRARNSKSITNGQVKHPKTPSKATRTHTDAAPKKRRQTRRGAHRCRTHKRRQRRQGATELVPNQTSIKAPTSSDVGPINTASSDVGPINTTSSDVGPINTASSDVGPSDTVGP